MNSGKWQRFDEGPAEKKKVAVNILVIKTATLRKLWRKIWGKK